jgi:hypothetical protein
MLFELPQHKKKAESVFLKKVDSKQINRQLIQSCLEKQKQFFEEFAPTNQSINQSINQI